MYIHCKCTSFDRDQRPSPNQLVKMLKIETPDVHSLDYSQSTVLIMHDSYAAESQGVHFRISEELPENNGTNACAFLALKLFIELYNRKCPDLMQI